MYIEIEIYFGDEEMWNVSAVGLMQFQSTVWATAMYQYREVHFLGGIRQKHPWLSKEDRDLLSTHFLT